MPDDIIKKVQSNRLPEKDLPENKQSEYRKPFSLEPHWYHDARVYEAEAAGVFRRNWQCAGHQSELVNSGDFVRLDFCHESILVIRGDDGVLRAFYNVCQHRGHILVAERRGNLTGKIRCPYHSWLYAQNGDLCRAPNEQNISNFPKDTIRLPEVRLEEYGSFVWVNTDPQAAPINEDLPGLDIAIMEHIPDVEDAMFFEGNKTTLPINWKTQVDNAIDTYHFQFSGPAHRQLTNSMEFTEFERETHGKWLVEWGVPARSPQNVGYEFDPEDSRGDIDSFVIIWVYPDLQIVAMPVSRTFFTYRTTPFGAESTVLDYAYYGAPEVQAESTTRDAIDWMNGPLSDEDNSVTTGVHLGHKSHGFSGAHFVIDSTGSRYSEHPGETFHRMLHDDASPHLS